MGRQILRSSSQIDCSRLHSRRPCACDVQRTHTQVRDFSPDQARAVRIPHRRVVMARRPYGSPFSTVRYATYPELSRRVTARHSSRRGCFFSHRGTVTSGRVVIAVVAADGGIGASTWVHLPQKRGHPNQDPRAAQPRQCLTICHLFRTRARARTRSARSLSLTLWEKTRARTGTGTGTRTHSDWLMSLTIRCGERRASPPQSRSK
jgi:hypothetical protein